MRLRVVERSRCGFNKHLLLPCFSSKGVVADSATTPFRSSSRSSKPFAATSAPPTPHAPNSRALSGRASARRHVASPLSSADACVVVRHAHRETSDTLPRAAATLAQRPTRWYCLDHLACAGMYETRRTRDRLEPTASPEHHERNYLSWHLRAEVYSTGIVARQKSPDLRIVTGICAAFEAHSAA